MARGFFFQPHRLPKLHFAKPIVWREPAVGIIGTIRDLEPDGPKPHLELHFPEGDHTHLPQGDREAITLLVDGVAWLGTMTTTSPGNPAYIWAKLSSDGGSTTCTELFLGMVLAEGARLAFDVPTVGELRLREIHSRGQWRPGGSPAERSGRRFPTRETEPDRPAIRSAIPSSRQRIPVPRQVPRDRSLQPLFLPEGGRSLRLRRAEAERAIHAYNSDSVVLSQERHAFASLGAGFRRGHVADQLRALDSAYSTRSVGFDLLVIGEAIERVWETWIGLLESAPWLADEAVEHERLRLLLEPFLGSATRRKTRSLATKALHFGAPTAFIPADRVATDALGRALRAGSWGQTAGLDTDGMARWYRSYLTVVHDIGKANSALMDDLAAIDSKTFSEPGCDRVRGLPKILDKMLWWVGREAAAGRHVSLFELE